MATTSGLPAITVLKLDITQNPVDVAADMNRQNTAANTSLPDMPFDDTAMHTQAGKILTKYNNFKAKPPTATRADVDVEINKGADMYNANAAYIETQARSVAKTAGDINVGINLVDNSGYYQKSPKSATNKEFSAYIENNGTVKITTKAIAPRAIYIRQYGATPEEGRPPEKTEEFIIGEAVVFLKNLPKKTSWGIREAILLPISRTPEDNIPDTELEKKATQKTISDSHHRIFDARDETHYSWSDWIYFSL